jgi:hypothetical protein
LDRSWKDRNFYNRVKYEGHLITLKRLVARGLLKNIREMGVNSCGLSDPLICRVICSMTHLEKLSFAECQLTEDLAPLFRSCPKLTELHVTIVKSQKSEMIEELKNELRSGFQTLRLLELDSCFISGPAIQEMLT